MNRRVIAFFERNMQEVKHKKLRIILFVAAFVIAVAAFAFAGYQLTNQSPGYYEVPAEASEELPYYSYGFTFRYEFTGSSNEIKAERQRIAALYSDALKRIYRMTDPTVEYDGEVNLATLNRHLKETGSASEILPEDLYRILKDAWQKTEEGGGYAVTSGPITDLRDAILMSSAPETLDPLVNAETGAALTELKRLTAHELFKVSFSDADMRVTVKAPKELIRYLENEENESPILDLGILKKAYMLSYVAESLQAEKLTNGYLEADNCMSVVLQEGFQSEAPMYVPLPEDTEAEHTYTYGGFRIISVDPIAITGPRSVSVMRTFPLPEETFTAYTVTACGKTYLRHPWYDRTDGSYKDVVFSSVLTRYGTDIVNTVYENLRLHAMDTADDAKNKAISLKNAGYECNYALQ